MKTIRELEDQLLVKTKLREEVSASYSILDRKDIDDWRGKRLEERWHRLDAEISLLKWILNSENENGGKNEASNGGKPM